MGYHLQPDKQKSQHQQPTQNLRWLSALALMALALFDVHDGLASAAFAEDLDHVAPCLGVDPQDFGFAANGAKQPTIPDTQ